MDVLCTDKTGTLTQAKISLERHVDIWGADSARVLELAYVNSFFETGLKSPLDEAILAHEHLDVSQWKKIDEAPFDFERRRVSVLVDDGAMRMLVVKGAPEDVLRLSAHYEATETATVRAWDSAAREKAERQLEVLGTQGLRVLASPSSRSARTTTMPASATRRNCVRRFRSVSRSPKASAAKAIAALGASGVAVKIVTGDNELVTQHICAKLD
jgi:Mg2+-importing ATPase